MPVVEEALSSEVALTELAAMVEQRKGFVRHTKDDLPFPGAFATAMTVVADAERQQQGELDIDTAPQATEALVNSLLVKDALRRAGVRLDIYTELRITQAAAMVWGQPE